MNYEEYNDITVGELNQEIERLSKALSTASDPRERADAQARLDYLNQLDRTGVANWKAEKKEDTAEGIIANKPTSQKLIENAPNTLTEGQKKGNRGDNQVAMKYDPSYHDAKTTEQIKEEQINNIDKTPPEEPADKGDFSIGGSMEGKDFIGGTNGGGKKPEPKLKTENNNENNETNEINEKSEDKSRDKSRYKSSMYGILDAMRNGDIDKSTGIYFMLDALSKAARNTGIDIGNIGAQFTGGTVRNDYQDSLWNQRRGKMFENEVTSELNTTEGTDKEMSYSLAKEDLIGKGLSNEQADLALNASRTFNEKAEQFRAAGNDIMADLYALVGSAATREVGPEELAAIAASGVLNTPEGKAAADEILKMATSLMQTAGNAFGGINQIMSLFGGNK